MKMNPYKEMINNCVDEIMALDIVQELKPYEKQFAEVEVLEKHLSGLALKVVEDMIDTVKENYKGAFTDDAGNNCWYVDDLISIIESKKELLK